MRRSKKYKLPKLDPTMMVALIETLSPMLVARTETASRSDGAYERACRLNELANMLEPAIYRYYDDVKNNAVQLPRM